MDALVTALPARWADVEVACRELAAATRARFEAHPHHILGTLRKDGRPRLSGVNVMVDDGELWIGSMPGAEKARDLRRDPRCALHSAPIDEQLRGGDARIDAIARPLEPDAAKAWLRAHPQQGRENPEEGEVFLLAVAQIVLTEVDGEVLKLTTWSPTAGVAERSRR